MAAPIRRTAAQLLKKRHFTTSSAFRNRPETAKDDTNVVRSPYKDIPTLNCTANDFIWQNLDRWPDKTATVCAVSGRGYTYAQTHKMSMLFAASLRTKLKLREDDTVAILLPNVPEYPCILFGILQAGCIASPMNPAYTAHELQTQFETVNCKAVITSKQSYPTIAAALKSMKKSIPIIITDHEELPEGTIKYAELAEDMTIDTDCLKSVRRGPKDIGIIPFSSGTTGFPKGVVLTHGSIVALNQMIADPEIVAIKETTATYQTVMPAVLPFFHIFGFNVVLMNQMSLGCKLVTLPYFKPDLFIQSIAGHKANCLFLVPPMALFLGKHPAVTPKHLETLHAIICGAAPLSPEDAEAVVAKNKNILFRQGNGLTETNGSVSIGRNTEVNYASVGYTLGSTQTKIVDVGSGQALGPNQEGEIWFRGPNLMRGYWNNEEATREVLTEDGWFKTGDIGKYDEKHSFYVTDRIKELIKVKGFQVPPAELEAIIRTHPKVMDCAVVGTKDPITGEAPKAFLVVKPNQTVSEEEIKEYVNSKVIDFKKVKEVQFVDAIPKSAAGKILRKDLKAKYC
ncbi:4-coumarate--CoA ligase 1 [Plutella xylostella]|uniref:4-coumarate--CoA ligase 1 n=1 Tax=Plutella xylostella TaxID=51655 RepID=UPI0020326AA1|nr:4-coumarate--CoA ligase 1 [Plutella xylostella]